MSVDLIKWLLLATMAIVTIFFGLLPIKVVSVISSSSSLHNKASLIVSLLSCFAGGVFVSVCFLDMLPDALEAWEQVKQDTGSEIQYPVVQLISLASFFFVYIFEEVSSICCDKPHSHGSTDDKVEIVRTRDRFATVGSIFNPDGTVVQPRKISMDSVEQNGGEARILRSFVFVAAFILHVILECFAFGVQKDIMSVTTLFIGIVVHKAIVSFSIGMKLTRNHPKRWYIVVGFVVLIAACNFLGGSIGIIIESSHMSDNAKNMATAVLMSVSLGTFIYISFFEMLAPERANQHSNILQWMAAVLGFGLIAMFMAIF